MSDDLHHFRSRAVRALVLLHEQQLQAFAEVWKESRDAGVQLPETDDEHYRSLEHLLGHVLESARGYLRRMLIHLGRPAPDLTPVSALNTIGADLEAVWEGVMRLSGWVLAGRAVGPDGGSSSE